MLLGDSLGEHVQYKMFTTIQAVIYSSRQGKSVGVRSKGPL